jgi:hypothetical protein
MSLTPRCQPSKRGGVERLVCDVGYRGASGYLSEDSLPAVFLRHARK